MVRFKYRGDDEKLKGCELSEVSIDRNRIFPFQGTAFRNLIDRPGFCLNEKVKKVYYISWVGFISDWVMLK